ncbi:MAG TPA: aminotransferase class I/II-fold pyridoxal phosphate-dependent enzyme [Candidatus Avacidaminococcus intestinavium]|uniref:Aminotransferase class I/II-fold pyridoxal phosphate-dependent enzyme n=1 Tax=Candidatus Avacidaminococcus intestinavium TaxID=2840684 RepID=A0A9D1MPH9_9FIRM|nr:aminotransferase class I/II-fold pyridoxal phosphate-dependent enzyme [Candidatus Avacidaminococcus intestinavium]
MYSFANDYSEGAHPKILEQIVKTNLEQTGVYFSDEYCSSAETLIKKACGKPKAKVHFFMGGTQANATIISSALRSFQGVYSSALGHINTHEAGAIEYGGHKILTLPDEDGKLTAQQIEFSHQLYLNDPKKEHWVQPKMVYISQPTELGTLYSKQELTALATVCRKYDLFLFLDGARLGYALTSPNNDVSLEDIADLCDVFYIGGTKCGLLFGEAAVIVSPLLQADFHTIMKQHGAVLAKGRLLGLQFETLFTNNLYEQICSYGIKQALRIKNAFQAKGISFYTNSFTNQQFPILTNEQYHILKQKYVMGVWEELPNNRLAIRFCTSWATKESEVSALLADIATL